MNGTERLALNLVVACFIGLPLGTLIFGWGKVVVAVLTGNYRNFGE
jgi:hypothetical protein